MIKTNKNILFEKDTQNSKLKLIIDELNKEYSILNEDFRNLKLKLEEIQQTQMNNNYVQEARNEGFNKAIEQELLYYKNLSRDYERQIEELKRLNMISTHKSNLPNSFKISNHKENDENFKSQNYEKFDKERERELIKKYQLIEDSNAQANQNAALANQSLENFRRNKVYKNFN